ncbi:hypothetical protein BZG36_04375, partial [Bifiguratus adelaidae]
SRKEWTQSCATPAIEKLERVRDVRVHSGIAPEQGMQRGTETSVPDFGRLRSIFTGCQVCVADCRRREFTDQPREDMTFDAFVDVFESHRGSPDDPIECDEGTHDQRDLLYLKDWHFVRDRPEYGAYTVPDIFADDWLNGFWAARKDTEDDYRFCYMGGPGTFTPLHADVYRSYSWSANITGIKHWIFFPPDQQPLLRSVKTGQPPYLISEALADPAEYPNAAKAVRIDVWQFPGETIFVPSGWWHQVINESHTISINHNWANACNLVYLSESLVHDWIQARWDIRDLWQDKIITDVYEYETVVNDLVRANSGWDWVLLFRLLAWGVGLVRQLQNPSQQHDRLTSCEHPGLEDVRRDLFPSSTFILEQIRKVLDRFRLPSKLPVEHLQELPTDCLAKDLVQRWYEGDDKHVRLAELHFFVGQAIPHSTVVNSLYDCVCTLSDRTGF